MHPLHRTELLLGGEAFDRLQAASACVIGLGGVGSYAAEALVRSGLGSVTLVDFDKVCITNVNRQLHATRKTVGKRKVDLMAERARHINPACEVIAVPSFYEAETSDAILGSGYDFVLDCIDNMRAKIHLLSTCVGREQPVVAAMGAGGRLDPTRVRVSDLSKTHTDPFARLVRDLLRKRHGIRRGITAVWTDEPPNGLDAEAEAGFRCICPHNANDKHTCDQRLQIQGSVAWMPAIFGLTMAAEVCTALAGR